MTAPTIRPLRHKTLKGDIYARGAKAEASLRELLTLPEDQLVERCLNQLKETTDFVTSECLVYLVRIQHGSPAVAERLFKILVDRVVRRLPGRDGIDRRPLSLTGSNIADEVLGGFLEMLAGDKVNYDERLDFFELRFDQALKNHTRDAKKKVWRREKRMVSLVPEDDTGELPRDLEAAVGTEEGHGLVELERADYRARLAPAIESLPELQRRIMEMVRLGFPFYSENPDTMTIAKALGKSDKTIRNHHKLAVQTLLGILKGEK
jgi:hypothetical protein